MIMRISTDTLGASIAKFLHNHCRNNTGHTSMVRMILLCDVMMKIENSKMGAPILNQQQKIPLLSSQRRFLHTTTLVLFIEGIFYPQFSRNATSSRQSSGKILTDTADSTQHGCRRRLQIAWHVVARVPFRLHSRHPHTMGDVGCAWFGRNPSGG